MVIFINVETKYEGSDTRQELFLELIDRQTDKAINQMN